MPNVPTALPSNNNPLQSADSKPAIAASALYMKDRAMYSEAPRLYMIKRKFPIEDGSFAMYNGASGLSKQGL